MKREDLGKMLEANLGWPVLSSGGSPEYQKLIDDELQDGAEGFWNDVIEALIGEANRHENMNGIDMRDAVKWLGDQAIGDDE